MTKDWSPGLNPSKLREEIVAAEADLRRACAAPLPCSAEDPDLVLLEAEAAAAAGAELPRGPLPVGKVEPASSSGRAGAATTKKAVVAASADFGGDDKDAEEVVGTWLSGKGECRIFRDHMTNKLAFEEEVGEGIRIHGFLERREASPSQFEEGVSAPLCWQAEVAMLEEGEMPWYGPSFGERPDTQGEVQVLLRLGESAEPPVLESRIWVEGEDEDWQEPTRFRRQEKQAVPEASENLFVFGGS